MEANKQIEPFKDADLIILKNPISTARFGLTVLQTKVLFEAIAYFKTNQDKRTMKLYIRQFLQNIGVETNKYEYIAKEIDEMTEIPLRIQRTNKKGALDYLKVQLFSSADYKIDEKGYGFVEIEISDKLKPYFLEIAEGQFFYYHILNTRVLKSKYSIKLYLFLKSWKRKDYIDISMHDLRELVEIEPHEYSEYRYFKKRILEPAKAELTEKCDLTFDYQEIRVLPNNKRSEVIRIRFYIIGNKSNWNDYKKQREEKNKTIEIKENKPQKIDTLIQEKQQIIKPTIEQEPPKQIINQQAIIELFKEVEPQTTDIEIFDFLEEQKQTDPERLLDILLFAKQEKKKKVTIKNIYGYIIYGLNNSVGKGLYMKEQAKKEKEAQKKIAEQEAKQIKQWYENDFSPIYSQYLHDVGSSADLEQKSKFLEAKKREADENKWIKKHYFNEDNTPKPETMRTGLGVEICNTRGETKDTLFMRWIIENKGITVEKVNDIWKKREAPVF